MPQQHSHHQKPSDNVRFTLDIPREQHAYLKMLAAKRSISMKEYVLESLYRNAEKEAEDISIRENKFKKALKKVIKENDDVLKRLADK